MSDKKRGIAEKIFVNIGGAEQGMFIRGNHTENPVLLFLHGGPGMPEYFLEKKFPTGLEDFFTVCYWEQRGAGLSYKPGMQPAGITAEQLISDTIEVSNYLSKRFSRERIYLAAHSWGSLIGIQAAAQAPELYYAYIGIGQIVNQMESEKRAYAYMLEQYIKAGNKRAVNKLKQYPVLKSGDAVRTFFVSLLRDELMHKLGIGTMHTMKSVVTGIFIPVLLCRAYTFAERINIWRAKAFLRKDTILIDQLFAADLTELVPELVVPVYFISGAYDYTVNYGLSRAYLELLHAPVKGFYTFRHSAHSPMFEEWVRYLEIMTKDVLRSTVLLSDEPYAEKN